MTGTPSSSLIQKMQSKDVSLSTLFDLYFWLTSTCYKHSLHFLLSNVTFYFVYPCYLYFCILYFGLEYNICFPGTIICARSSSTKEEKFQGSVSVHGKKWWVELGALHIDFSLKFCIVKCYCTKMHFFWICLVIYFHLLL